jgi:enamine deaminase RidA (YjgF/YER057c/UK114 family)
VSGQHTGDGPETLQPAGWATPRGYVNGVAAEGRFVFVAGQIGWNAAQQFETDSFVGQARQALENVVAVLAVAGARPEHLTRLTWYITDRVEYRASLRELGRVYREVIGPHYPAMTLVQVAALLEDRARVEIEATAVIPPCGDSNE